MSEQQDPILVGIIGLGRIAQHHIMNLQTIPGVHIQAVADVLADRVAEVARQHSATPYQDFEEMLDKEKLDAVLICTPPTVRFDPIKKAAKRSVAVFVEKPPAFDMDAALRTLRVIEQHGIINSVGFMYRWSKAIDFLKDAIAGMPLNMIRSIFVCGPALDPEQPKWFFNKALSGGPVLDQAIHILDLTRYIAGDVVAVHAFGANVVCPKSDDFTVEDSVSINLLYRSGAVQSHTHSWAYPGEKLEIELISDRHHLYVTPDQVRGTINGDEVFYKPSSNNFYRRELVEFLEAVRQNDQSRIRSPYSDAIKTLATVLAANQSVDSGGVVDLTALPWSA